MEELVHDVESCMRKVEAHLGEGRGPGGAPSSEKPQEPRQPKQSKAIAPSLDLPAPVAAFMKCDIRVATITSCQVPDFSEKLLLLTIDIGGGETRDFASGIAKYYSPDDLVGKKIMAILNLKPRPMVGGAVVSNAMLFCGSTGEGDEAIVRVCWPPQDAPAGTRIYPDGYEAALPNPPPTADPKKNFGRMTDCLTVKDGKVVLGAVEVRAGTWGSVTVEVADGAHVR
ncbi:Methionyl-tRNA synthetase [Giardia muris]|uniref:Methionyl-tRNA synthetase n=1 Tax=Giardia muris TaxID=5742 RepID=A0A4Z1SU33_GIAMU|nr:Methionyl-tRNA synthetase [Giardia muris]|eukprot:TNJ27128.1 Methionyl-tRNA synthetase [Giardia muris]